MSDFLEEAGYAKQTGSPQVDSVNFSEISQSFPSHIRENLLAQHFWIGSEAWFLCSNLDPVCEVLV